MGAIAGAIGSIGSSIIGGGAARKAANQQAGQINNAMTANQAMWDETNQQYSPYLQGGTNAFNTLANMQNTGDMSQFFTSPQYQFALQQGLKGQANQAAGKGLSTAPRTAQALGNYAQNMASGEFQNYFNNMANLGTTGFNAASQLGQLGGQYSGLRSGLYQDLGNIYAQKNLATGAANQGILGGVMGGLSGLGGMMGGGYTGGLGGLFGGSGLANNAGLRTALTGQSDFVGPLPY